MFRIYLSYFKSWCLSCLDDECGGVLVYFQDVQLFQNLPVPWWGGGCISASNWISQSWVWIEANNGFDHRHSQTITIRGSGNRCQGRLKSKTELTNTNANSYINTNTYKNTNVNTNKDHLTTCLLLGETKKLPLHSRFRKDLLDFLTSNSYPILPSFYQEHEGCGSTGLGVHGVALGVFFINIHMTLLQ